MWGSQSHEDETTLPITARVARSCPATGSREMMTRDRRRPRSREPHMARIRSVSRREFIAGTVAATAAGPLLATATAAQDQKPAPAAITRKVKLGVVGLGGRGHWIAG